MKTYTITIYSINPNRQFLKFIEQFEIQVPNGVNRELVGNFIEAAYRPININYVYTYNIDDGL